MKSGTSKKRKPPHLLQGRGFLETRVVSRSTLSRTCEGGNKYDDDDKNDCDERKVQQNGVRTLALRDRNAPYRTACGGVVRAMDAALRHDRREPRRLAQCQAPMY